MRRRARTISQLKPILLAEGNDRWSFNLYLPQNSKQRREVFFSFFGLLIDTTGRIRNFNMSCFGSGTEDRNLVVGGGIQARFANAQTHEGERPSLSVLRQHRRPN